MPKNPSTASAPTLEELRAWFRVRPQFAVFRGAGEVRIVCSRTGGSLTLTHASDEGALRELFNTSAGRHSKPFVPRHRRKSPGHANRAAGGFVRHGASI